MHAKNAKRRHTKNAKKSIEDDNDAVAWEKGKATAHNAMLADDSTVSCPRPILSYYCHSLLGPPISTGDSDDVLPCGNPFGMPRAPMLTSG